MAAPAPMDILRDLAEKTLNDTTSRLGRARQAHAMEMHRLEQLQSYERDYRQRMQNTLVGEGVSVIALQAYQGFIGSLGRVVARQTHTVNDSERAVEETLCAWRKDKQRLNAFETLQNRAEARRLLYENRQDQKMMDEFARRASQRNK
ncbi:Flagellar FliJ protein [Enterobacter sp. DC4]|uniref:flagellar export protein FliJ n=1 Tax=Enterobacter sp. DC4 TaxID=1395580 RepID=UPI0003ECF080|nr:flagellar export protein FliJ [Enterobacter sp. DC4]EWG67265.1 Flagellar FliJ protein [Enterobacter sp. DC4]